MADEIRFTSTFTVAKGYLKFSKSNETITADLSGTRYSVSVQDVGSGSHEGIQISADVSTAGWAIFRNVGDTYSVQVGGDEGGTFVPVLQLLPGESNVIRLATLSVYAKGVSGTASLESTIFEG